MRTRPALERFLEKIDFGGANGCWVWTGAIVGRYGRFRLDGETTYAHRASYQLLVGPIPDGYEIDHVRARGCRSTRCVNPDHLEAVTHRENILRSPTCPLAVHARKTHCIRGHEFTSENTRVYRARSGPQRSCVACEKLRAKAYRRPKSVVRLTTPM